MSGFVWERASRFCSANNHLHARTFLSRLDPAGSSSADRSLVDGDSAVAQKPGTGNDRPWAWRWPSRLFILCQAFVIDRLRASEKLRRTWRVVGKPEANPHEYIVG